MKVAARRGLIAAQAIGIVIMVGCSATIGGDGSGAGGGSGESGATGGVSGGGNTGTAGEMNPGDGGTPTDANCFQLRRCVSSCKDPACAQRCLDLGSAAGRLLFDQLQTCSQAACPDQQQQDPVCRCEAECIFPGPCAELLDTCADGIADPDCDMCA